MKPILGRLPGMVWLHSVMLFLLVAIAGCSDVESHDWKEQPDPETGVALILGPDTQTIKGNLHPVFTLTLANNGKQELTLVEPGDGSDRGWRTPVLEWSRRSREPQARICGNTNPLKEEEVFTLQPGESRTVTAWTGEPYVSGPGRYQVSLRYRNEPGREWRGGSFGENDKNAMERVRRSTPVSITSNSVEVIVER